MSTERQRDAEMDRLLRAAIRPAADPETPACADAQSVAAYVDGGLSPEERSTIEVHLASCARCQSVLAMVARDGVDAPAAKPAWTGWTRWLALPHMRWLAPAAAVAAGVLVYVAVVPPAGEPAREATSTTATASRREFTLARKAEQPASALPPEPAGPDARRLETRETARSAAPETGAGTAPAAPAPPASAKQQTVAPAEGLPPEAPAGRTRAAVADAAPAVVSVEAAVPPPPQANAVRAVAAEEKPAAAPDRLAKGAVADESGRLAADRDQGVSAAGTPCPDTLDLGALWARADLVVLARAGRTGDLVRVGRTQMFPTEFDVLEVFKRRNEVAPDPRGTLWQPRATSPGGERPLVVLRTGGEYVLFLERLANATQAGWFGPSCTGLGVYRLDGHQVFVAGHDTPDPVLSRDWLLAQLRQRAGTATRD